MKTCTKCAETKLLADFYTWHRSKDGHTARCEPCVNEANRKWHADNRESHLVAMRRYRAEHLEDERENSARWYRENTDRHRALGQKWIAENPERRREIQTAYAGRNRELVNARIKEWADANPDRRAEYQNRRRARKLAVSTESLDRRAIWKRDGGRCHFCGGKVALLKMHLDHLIPLARGGSHTADNVAVSCPPCNLKSGPGRLPAQLRLVG